MTSITSNILRRLVLASVATATAWCGAISVLPTTTFAQSPSPNANFLNQNAGTVNLGEQGVVVEGLGMGSCSYSLSSVESTTVTYLNDSKGTYTEISPQSHCASLSSYESMISSLISYVDGHSSHAGSLWYGVMLDEEPNFGFTVPQLQSLNSYTHNAVLYSSGLTWWSAENATWSGAWSQSQFDSLQSGSIPAPQVYNSYMAAIANGSGANYQLVTWTTDTGSPWNSESYTTGAVHGAPWGQTENGTFYYWANQWQP